jgi:hypothetical protein
MSTINRRVILAIPKRLGAFFFFFLDFDLVVLELVTGFKNSLLSLELRGKSAFIVDEDDVMGASFVATTTSFFILDA